MENSFNIAINVNQSPEQAYKAIMNLRAWWSQEIVGNTENLNEVFHYHYKDVHNCRMQLIEQIPNQKLVWLVIENHFNFTKEQGEWLGTKVCFEISVEKNKTLIRFTHLGLIPGQECYEICHNAWTENIQQSLFNLISTGKGQPNPIETVLNQAAEQAAKRNVN